MKRNLNAIIALMLVVVMVFPTAIFVGAADPAITAKLNGENFANGGTISVPEEVSAALTFTIPEGYSATVKETNTGASLYAVEGNVITFTGVKEGKTNVYTITAKKEGAADLTFTANVACVPVELKADTVKLTSVNGTSVTTLFDCEAGTEITAAALSGTLTNGKAAEFENIKFSLDGTTYTDKVKVTAANNGSTLYVQYTVKDVTGTFTPKQIILIVSGMAVSEVTAVKNSNISHDTDSITAEAFGSGYVNVKATLNGTKVGIESGYTIAFLKNNAAWTGTTIDNSNIEGLTFKVTYEGVTSIAYNVSEFISLTQETPKTIAIDLSGLTKKEYVAGEKVTEVTLNNVKNFVTVKDTEGQTIPAEKLFFKNVEFDEFVFGAGTVKVTVTVNGKTLSGFASLADAGIEVAKRAVTGIEMSTKSTMKTTYAEGDALDLAGLWLKVSYNYGDPVDIQYSNFDFTCNPQAGAILNSTDKNILVVYKDPDTKQEFTCSIPLTVEAASVTKKIKEVKLLSSSGAKRDYYIGEAFDANGLEILIVYSDASTSVVELTSANSSSITVDSTRYDNTSKKFTNTLSGDLKISFNITYKVDGTEQKENVSVTVPGVTVIKRPNLVSIVAESDKEEYMEGDSARVYEFTITAKYDNGDTRVFKVDETVTAAAKSTYSVTEGGVTYTVKLTPTTIESTTTSIRVSYTERVTGSTSVTKYADVPIEVMIPDAILTYYDTVSRTYVSEAHDNLIDALNKAEEIVRGYSSAYASRIPEIELRRDVTMLTDFDATESVEIDLHGYTLTMIRGEIYVNSRAASGVTVEFFNTDKTDGKLVYSTDDDDTVIIAYNDEYVIDKDTDSAGKYAVVISTVKNGKVTGPSEVTHGHDAIFTITPDEGYAISTIKVNNKTQTVPADGKLTVEDVQAKVTITVTFAEKAWENPFTDVDKSATYYKSVQFVYEEGLFTGMSATKFEPDTTMTRAMFVTVLGRLAGIDATTAASRYGYTSTFTDVSSSDQSIRYAIPYIKWASDNGLIEGYGNGKFGPKDNITHAQMYVLMARYALLIEKLNTNASGTNIAANDRNDIPDWAYTAVEYAAKKSFLITSSNRLTPNANAKRSELAMLLDKFCTNVLGD